jgi:hypothetical protein
MGRPKQTEPRSEQLNLSFSTRELEDIKARARALGMRPSHFGRTLLLGKSGRAPSDAGSIDNSRRLIHNQLVRLGNNLNQVVKYLYRTGRPLPSDLEPLLNDIRCLIAKVSE